MKGKSGSCSRRMMRFEADAPCRELGWTRVWDQCSSSLPVLPYPANMKEKLLLSPADCNSIVKKKIKNLLQVAIWHLLPFPAAVRDCRRS